MRSLVSYLKLSLKDLELVAWGLASDHTCGSVHFSHPLTRPRLFCYHSGS